MNSVKRYIAFLLSLTLIVLIFTSCSGKNSNNSGNDTSNSVPSESVTEKETKKNNDYKLVSDLFKFPIPDTSIYISIPDLHSIESGASNLFYQEAVKLVSISYAEYSDVKELDKVFDEVFQWMIGDFMNYLDLNGDYDLKFEKVTVNGIDALKFKGTVDAKYNSPSYDAYAYGYAFIYQDIPCVIFGSVIDESQPQSEIDYVTQAADEMMESLRSEP